MKRVCRVCKHFSFFAICLVLSGSMLLASISSARATAIDNKYAQLGGANGFLGAPTMAEKTLPDGWGRFRHFQGGSIYWHPATGAREVHGLIRQRWAQLNWERGYLGYPMTDEINLVDGSGKVSKFQGGQLIWRSATNQVSEVRSTDLIVDWPFPVGQPWRIIQANAVNGGSHRNEFAYCWDMVRADPATVYLVGVPFAAAARAKVVYVEQSLPSGNNAGNVVVQRFGEGRYGSYLHIKQGSYAKRYATSPGINLLPQALPWESRPTPNTGALLGEVGDTGTGKGNYHMHFCVTTTPDRATFGPFESVPVAFRNYSYSTGDCKTKSFLGTDLAWTYVKVGVPKVNQCVRREAAKPGQPSGAQVNNAAKVLSYGTVKGQIKLTPGDGKPTGAGTLKIVVSSKWGEPLRSTQVAVTMSTLSGPWPFEIKNVPAYNGMTVSAAYSGAWDRPYNIVGGASGPFNLAPNGTNTSTLALKTTSIH